MMPYYSDDLVTLYHGDCRDVLPSLPRPDLMLADPPYGIAARTDNKTQQRGYLGPSNNYPPVLGDDRPFDPSHLLGYERLILFGANHYADRLPPSPSWLVWDKLDGLTSRRELGFNDNADCEFIWTNLGGAARILSHRWLGAMKGSEQRDQRVHPTQKPVVLMRRLVEQFTDPGALVIDPYCGSGSTGVACVLAGRRFIGIERVQNYVVIARRRIEDARAQLQLFGAA